MIICYLGPEEVMASAEIFDKIKMKRDATPFSNRSHASNFLRALQMPKNKYLVRKFIAGVFPIRLAKNLEMMGFKKLNEVKAEFLSLFNQSYKARITLVGNGGMEEERKSVGPLTGKFESTSGKSAYVNNNYTNANIGVSVGSRTTPARSEKPVASAKSEVKTNPQVKVCYHCGQPGHIRPACPQNNIEASEGGPEIRINGWLRKRRLVEHLSLLWKH